jgi:hypothetical protein
MPLLEAGVSDTEEGGDRVSEVAVCGWTSLQGCFKVIISHITTPKLRMHRASIASSRSGLSTTYPCARAQSQRDVMLEFRIWDSDRQQSSMRHGCCKMVQVGFKMMGLDNYDTVST